METSIFGPERPVTKFNFFWKSIFSLLVAAMIFGASTLVNLFQTSAQLKEISVVMESFSQISQIDEAAAGGDVLIEPAKVVKPNFPILTGELSPPENFSAKSIIVKDAATGGVLFQKNEYEKRPIASITKLMSALVLLEKPLDWTKAVEVVGQDALDTHVYAGEVYAAQELWYAAFVGSSNKAVLSLVEAGELSREEFVARMNQKAREFGMTDTSFVDPTGLDDGNVASASDLAILLNNALGQEKIIEALLTPEYTLYFEDKKHHIWNTNWLLLGWIQNDFQEFFGGKTGFTNAAGYSFVVRVGDDSGQALDVVILGADSHEARFTEASDAANMVFDAYQWPTKNGGSHFE